MPKPKPIPSEVVLDFKKIRNAIYEVGDGKNVYARKQLLEEACKVAHDVTERWKKKMRDSGQVSIAPGYNWEDQVEFETIEVWVTAGRGIREGTLIPYDELSTEHRDNIIAMLEREEVIHLFPNLIKKVLDNQPKT